MRNIRIDSLCRLGGRRMAAIRDLERVCREYDGTHSEAYLRNDLNVHKYLRCFFMAYLGNELIGFLNLFVPDESAAEVSAFVRPDMRRRGVFTKMLEAAKDELDNWYIYDLLYAAEPVSKDAEAAARNMGLVNEHGELLMKAEAVTDEAAGKNVRTGDAVEEKAEETTCTHDGLICVRNDNCIAGFDYLFDGCKVGSVCLNEEQNSFCIFDVLIYEQYRGRGLGQRMMRLLMEYIRFHAPDKDIILEVSRDNGPAVHIYKKLGFNIVSAVNYYTEKAHTRG